MNRERYASNLPFIATATGLTSLLFVWPIADAQAVGWRNEHPTECEYVTPIMKSYGDFSLHESRIIADRFTKAAGELSESLPGDPSQITGQQSYAINTVRERPWVGVHSIRNVGRTVCGLGEGEWDQDRYVLTQASVEAIAALESVGVDVSAFGYPSER